MKVNKSQNSGLSLIIPCYNEEGHLLNSHQKVTKELKRLNLKYELIFIDDKSQDNTRKDIIKIINSDKYASHIFHKRNFGRGKTVMDGILAAKYEYVGFLDIDLEVSEKYINKFIKKLNSGDDVVIGNRSYKNSLKSLHRVILSRGYQFLKDFMLDVPFTDTEAGYKFFRRSKILTILNEINDFKWFWDTEIVARSHFSGLKVSEVPVVFKRKPEKKSTVKIFSDSYYYFLALWSFRRSINQEKLNFYKILKRFNSDLKTLGFISLKMSIFPFIKMSNLLPKEGVFLDLGCGEGTFTNILGIASPKRIVIGIDYSTQLINKAKKLARINKNVKFECADILKKNLPHCDVIILSDTLHHFSFENQEKILNKCAKALKNNGILLIRDVNESDYIKHKISKFWDDLLYPRVERAKFRTLESWKNILIKHKFSVKDTISNSQISLFSILIILSIKDGQK